MTDQSRLDDLTAALPRSIEPPADLWNDIRADITQRRPVSVWTARNLLAAGVVIAVASSAVTAAVMNERGGTQTSYARTGLRDLLPGDAPAGSAILPVFLASTEKGYITSVEILQRTLNEKRATLSPSTVAIVERSLRVSDSAIAEARDALARDPGNRALAALFASNYERKIDLLRRANELGSQ